MDTKELRNLQEAYLEVVEGQQLDEADSLAAMQARREKRLAAQRKREGTTATGRDFGRDDSLSADQQKKRREAEFKAGTKKEEVSVYDIVLSHLIDEGYADTVESAEGIMINMSEEWREEIIDEANKAERELGLSSRAREQARNLNRNADKPIFYKNSQMGKSSDSILNKAHKRMTAKRQASHKAGRKVEKANKAL